MHISDYCISAVYQQCKFKIILRAQTSSAPDFYHQSRGSLPVSELLRSLRQGQILTLPARSRATSLTRSPAPARVPDWRLSSLSSIVDYLGYPPAAGSIDRLFPQVI